MGSVERNARRLDRLEREVRAGNTQPRLGHSSIDSGAIELRDGYGNVAGFVGQQFDGTITTAAVGGSWPTSPTMPLVTAISGGLRLYWDGTYADGSPSRMDWKRTTFHAVTNLADLDILNPGQIVGEVTIAVGGEVTVALPSVEHFVVAVAWTDAGKFSEPSDPAFGTPLVVVDEAQWQEHEDALTELKTVTLPALDQSLANLDTELAANTTEINTLRDVTLPALDAELDANAAALATLETDLNTVDTTAQQAAADAAAAVTTATAAQQAADGAIRTFGPEEYPTSPPWPDNSAQDPNVVGDLWLNDAGVAHRWNGTVWYVIPDDAAASALAAANAAQSAASAASSAAAAAQSDVDLVEGRVTTAEGNISSVTSRVTTAEGNISSVTSRVTTAEATVSNHETRIDTAEGSLTTVDSRLDSAESTITNHETRIDTAETDISTVESNVSTVSGDVSTLTNRVTTAEGTVTDHTTRITSAESTIQNHTTRLGTAESNITSVTTIANGKSKTTYSTSAPGTTSNSAGDTWFQVSGSEVIGVWKGNGGTSWTAEKYGGAILDHLDAGTITVGTLAAERIGALSINTGHLAAGAVDAGKIKAGSIDTTKIVTAGLDAATIKFGTMSGARIETGTLVVGQVSGLTAAIDSAEIAAIEAPWQNTNSTFSNWTAAAPAPPAGYAVWGGTLVKNTTDAQTGPYAAEFNTDGTVQAGLQESAALDGMPIGLDYVTVELDFMVKSGLSLSGAGVLLDWAGMTGTFRSQFSLSSHVPNPVLNKMYRVTRVLKKPAAAAGTQTSWLAYAMADYSGLGALAAKNIVFDRWAFRPSTAEEITAYETPNNYGETKTLVAGWRTTGQTTIEGGKIRADSILAAQIGAGQITATKIATDAVTAGKVAADAIDAREIKAGAITATEIATDAVTAGKVAADAIDAREIKAGAITATEISTGAVVAGKIAADAVTATTIAADAVTATKVAANAIIAGKIAANAVTATTIAANAVTADKLDANAITAKHTITGPVIRTAVSGERLEINTGLASEIKFYSGEPTETSAGGIYADTVVSGGVLQGGEVSIRGPQFGGNPAYLGVGQSGGIPRISLQSTDVVTNSEKLHASTYYDGSYNGQFQLVASSFWLGTTVGSGWSWSQAPGVSVIAAPTRLEITSPELRVSGKVTQGGDTGWASATLNSAAGWSNYGSPFVVARYRKVMGVVYLQGLVKGGSGGSTILTLPSGFRPTGGTHFFSTKNDSADTHLSLDGNGNLSYGGGTSGWVVLNAVIFPAD